MIGEANRVLSVAAARIVARKPNTAAYRPWACAAWTSRNAAGTDAVRLTRCAATGSACRGAERSAAATTPIAATWLRDPAARTARPAAGRGSSLKPPKRNRERGANLHARPVLDRLAPAIARKISSKSYLLYTPRPISRFRTPQTRTDGVVSRETGLSRGVPGLC